MSLTRTCLLFLTLQLASIISCQEVVKRAPTGFVGMRGKKFFGSEEPDRFYKRIPQFFVGVRGKNRLLDYETDHYKRAPMGFVGMRGKKDVDYEDNYPEFKRAPMGFVGMRGKKELDSSELNYFDNYGYPKRASLFGQIDYSSKEELKDPGAFPLLNRLLNKYLQQIKQGDTSIEISPSNDTDVSTEGSQEEITNDIEKRATHMNNFYGVRGKKSLQAKRPFDLSFRGKFIGVRGKKDLKNSGMNEVKFLLDNAGPWPKRKGQMSGFFGMRGKKWAEGSSLEMEYPN